MRRSFLIFIIGLSVSYMRAGCYPYTNKNKDSIASITDENCIDLGLSSGTLWATHNIGAVKPTGRGSYFAWGENSPKSSYTRENYKFLIPSNYEFDVYSKYVTDSTYSVFTLNGDVESHHPYYDGKYILDLIDDASCVLLGDDWRTPSIEQFQELINCCKWEWSQVEGTAGYVITGPNGNNMFLPTTGIWGNKSQPGGMTQGHYWTCEMVPETGGARACSLWMKNSEHCLVYNVFRWLGFNIRPVKVKGAHY